MLHGVRTSIRAKLALLAGVPVVGALLLALFVAHDARQRAASAASLGSIEDLARLASYTVAVLHAVQDERAAWSIAEGQGPRGRDPTDAFQDTDAAAKALDTFLATRQRGKLPTRLAGDLVEADADWKNLAQARAGDRNSERLLDALSRYGAATNHLVSAVAALSELSDDGDMLRNISAMVALLELEERSSIEHAVVGYSASRGEFPPGAYKALVTTTTEEHVYDQGFRTSASDDVRHEFETARLNGHSAREMLDACLSSTEDTVALDPAAWNRAEQQAIFALRGVERILLGRIETAAAGKGAQLREAIRLSTGVSIAVLLLSVTMAVFVGRRVQGSVDALASAARQVQASRDFSIRARRVSDDELGVLTDTFNEMLAGIQTRDVELEQHRSHLEGLVARRTKELAARNTALRLVLDNVEQGLATIGVDGTLHPERSAAFDRWFPSGGASRAFADVMAADDERTRLLLNLGWEQVADGILPAEVSLEQLPKRLHRDGRQFTLAVKPISDGDALAGGLLVVTDVTAELEARREQARQKEDNQVFRRLARDKGAFVAFLEETGNLVERLRGGAPTAAEQLAMVHTVKGNSAQYDVRSVADAAHAMETAIVDTGAPLDAEACAPLLLAWDALVRQLAPLVGTSDSNVQIARGELDRLVRFAAGGLTGAEMAGRLRALFDEPVSMRFARLGDHAERLASRLGKPVPAFTIETDDLRLPRQRYAPFWAGLVHVVRNAVDHGIEDAEARATAGKPARGNVEFRARVHAGDVVIEVADDGAGIDWDRIAAKARAAGLPAARRPDLERALFVSGLSTRDQVTDISGRGVGLAAMWDATASLGGTVSVESVRGRETRFVFRLPFEQESRGAA
jgi:two-component system, chemotaxis family, sensor kinase CheA